MVGNQPRSLTAIGLTTVFLALFVLQLNSHGSHFRSVSLFAKNSPSSDSTDTIMPDQKVKYYYIPTKMVSALQGPNPGLKGKIKSSQESLADEWTPNFKRITVFSQGAAPANTSRLCDVHSLISQASLVMEGWDQCGYLALKAGM